MEVQEDATQCSSHPEARADSIELQEKHPAGQRRDQFEGMGMSEKRLSSVM